VRIVAVELQFEVLYNAQFEVKAWRIYKGQLSISSLLLVSGACLAEPTLFLPLKGGGGEEGKSQVPLVYTSCAGATILALQSYCLNPFNCCIARKPLAREESAATMSAKSKVISEFQRLGCSTI